MRSGRVPKRVIAPDVIYNSRLLSKFINRLMRDGKKSIAQKLIYQALDKIHETSRQDPMDIFEKAIKNVIPKMEVRPRRVGGASYQVPMEVRGDRKETLAIRWLIQAAQARSNKDYHTFDQKLVAEILDASNNTGGAVKKKDEIQRTAQANRAFAHFRW